MPSRFLQVLVVLATFTLAPASRAENIFEGRGEEVAHIRRPIGPGVVDVWAHHTSSIGDRQYMCGVRLPRWWG